MIDHRHYTYRVTWSAEDGEFVALCAEFPSLSFLDEVIEDIKANGEDVPQPLADRVYSGKFQVRIPPEQHRALAIQAAEQGVSLNRLVSAKLG